MTEDELFAALSEAVGRHGLGLAVERDPIGRVVVGDADRTWRLIFRPGPLPLEVTREGSPPTGDERMARGFWSVVNRLTAQARELTVSEPAGELSASDRAGLQRMKERLTGRPSDRTGEEPSDEGRVPVG